MSAYAISALVMVLSLFFMVIKQIKGEYALAASSVICLILIGLAINLIYPIIDYITSLTLFGAQSEHFKIVMKSVGVALLCGVACEICKDSGENALAYGVEIFCKCEILAMSLPLLKEILDLAKEIMEK